MKVYFLLSLFVQLLVGVSYGSITSGPSKCRAAATHSDVSTSKEYLPEPIRTLLTKNSYQRAYWAMKEQGFTTEANELRARIEKVMNSLQDSGFTPEKWQLMTVGYKGTDLVPPEKQGTATHGEDAMNTLYRVVIEGIPLVIKFTDHPESEAAISLVADIMNIYVPITVAVEIAGRPAAIQYFLEEAITIEKRAENLGVGYPSMWLLPHNVQMFLELIQKYDDHQYNHLFIEDSSLPSKGLFISIDHDLTVNGWFNFQGFKSEYSSNLSDPAGFDYPPFWQESSRAEIREVMEIMATEYPSMHQSILDPKTVPLLMEALDVGHASTGYRKWMTDWIYKYRELAEEFRP